MKLDVSSAKNLEYDDHPVASEAPGTGTVLTIRGLTNKFIRQFSAMDGLRLGVLIGLLLDIEVSGTSVWLFGKHLDPDAVKASETRIPFSCDVAEGRKLEGVARVLAWTDNAQFVSHKHSFYYDSNNRFVAKRPSGVAADTRYPAHTLIVTAAGLENYSDLEGDFGPFEKIERAIRPQVVKFLLETKRSSFADTLNQIFENENYPFKNHVKSPLEEAKITAYNAVLGALVLDNASVVAPKKKAVLKMVFPLLDRLMSGDALLGDNIDRLLDLDGEHAEKFNRVFSRIKLSSIIDRYNRLKHRYDFLQTLDKLVHVGEYADILLERSQLHKIVERELWIFGPEYEQQNLLTSDQSLVTLLRERVKRTDILFDTSSDRDELRKLESFIEANRSDVGQCLNKIPDLVLAKTVRTSQVEDSRQFLVIELKRPSVKINKACREQAREIFTGVLAGTKGGGLVIDSKHRWRYCLVSSDIDDELDPEFGENQHLEVKMGGNYVVDVLVWSDIIEQARKRLDEEMDGINVEVQESDCQELLQEYGKLFGVKSTLASLAQSDA